MNVLDYLEDEGTCVYVGVYMCVCTCACACVNVGLHVYLCACTEFCVCMSVFLRVCVCVCLHRVCIRGDGAIRQGEHCGSHSNGGEWQCMCMWVYMCLGVRVYAFERWLVGVYVFESAFVFTKHVCVCSCVSVRAAMCVLLVGQCVYERWRDELSVFILSLIHI